MTRGKRVVALAVLLLAAAASTAIRPSFHPDDSAWKATHIVLATEESAIDGKLEVIESWKGDPAPGSQVAVPALATFAGEGRRQVHWFGRQGLPEPCVRSVAGAKMVLFLIRPRRHWEGPRPAADNGDPPQLWRGPDHQSSQRLAERALNRT